LGVITRLTLDISPAFAVRQDVYMDVPFAALETDVDEITGAGYSVSMFTAWRGPTIGQVWVKRRAEDEDDAPKVFSAARAVSNVHPIAAVSAESCTAQMGIAGPWHERLPHFRMGFTPSFGEELQTEYLVPRRHAWPALTAVAALGPRIAPLLQISEIRTIAADGFWMSPFYETPCVGIHFTWRQDWEGVRALLPEIEAALAAFEPRPHWGKLFTMAPDAVSSRYPRLQDFRRLARELDPDRVFTNAFVEPFIG
ncbi:MAG TPA: D-arabinono-1,4-lactone oxidase, partial [Chthonomonadaceae bacterium]|nr:D-arabinono-1,4-lactone oxidase [Chthonomonadaceae bacterium]